VDDKAENSRMTLGMMMRSYNARIWPE